MRHERQEFQDLLNRRKKEGVRRNERELRQIAQADVPMEAMTHSEEWDFFLSMLQDQIEGLEGVIGALHGASLSDPSFDPNEMSQHKARILQAETQKATLQQVLLIPKQIMEKGENAKLALDSILDE